MQKLLQTLSLITVSLIAAEALAQVNTGSQINNANQNINRNQFDGGQVEIESEFLDDERRNSFNDAAAGQGGLAGAQRLFQGLANQQGANSSRQSQSFKSRVVRAPLRIGFSVNDNPQTARVLAITQQSRINFSSLPRFRQTTVRVASQSSTLVLTGSVNTPAERELAERVAKLQPGISTVDNQLVVLEK